MWYKKDSVFRSTIFFFFFLVINNVYEWIVFLLYNCRKKNEIILWRCIYDEDLHVILSMNVASALWKIGALQNPSKRFCRFPKVLKCVQNLEKRIKNSTEPFEGSAFYSTPEPSLTEPFFGFCTTKKGSVRKYGTLRVLYKTINLW
jgi:hypothetical protein